jgi:2,3-bisphosphoglycerate-independent phosphoglycerate mutase
MSKQSNLPAVLLLILDGWGVAPASEQNAITQASTPQWDQWLKEEKHSLIDASGTDVGLPESQMGNSEVGHMHIGAGRVIEQDLTRINDTIDNKTFFSNPTLIDAISKAKKAASHIHLIGLLSDGGVHSHQSHLFALLSLLDQQNVSDCSIHAFLDGRDTPPKSAKDLMSQCEAALHTHPVGHIASVTGRFYAMDRDARWERTEATYRLLTEQHASHDSPLDIISSAYQHDLTDEFIPPTATARHRPIQDGDLVIFFNFRSDRARQLSEALTDSSFTHFKKHITPTIQLLTMTQYASNLNATVIFPKLPLKNTLGECVEKAGLNQLRIAETEKYAHVTFFFNGGKEAIFEGEDRELIPSPKVATYNLKPEMSANEINEKLVRAIQSKHYSLIICNFANADMVGHTGDFPQTVKAIETLDNCFKQINQAIKKTGAYLVVTADHGNAEKMFDNQSQQTHTAHTSSKVPFLCIGPAPLSITTQKGSLIDIAPTVLHLLQLPKPKEMTGNSLIAAHDEN